MVALFSSPSSLRSSVIPFAEFFFCRSGIPVQTFSADITPITLCKHSSVGEKLLSIPSFSRSILFPLTSNDQIRLSLSHVKVFMTMLPLLKKPVLIPTVIIVGSHGFSKIAFRGSLTASSSVVISAPSWPVGVNLKEIPLYALTCFFSIFLCMVVFLMFGNSPLIVCPRRV